MSGAPVVWYLRSIGDHDSHRGALRPAEGTVLAACGVTFVSRALPFSRGLGFSGTPPDPQQVCPACARATR
ncbi:MAG: hypothetical protein JO063_11150 [Pseudonocardiales bacterium]|nr:hypothetical protein [Pseudonocardiales bacterium]MBV9031141.1 hypothetical protein [Pseudonocardiales bacterium]MBW0010654.1 hypothetical protein [Pseudonocardiales bacterium]